MTDGRNIQGAHPRHGSISTSPSRLPIALLILGSALAWWWLHRSWFLSGDDYLFIADPGSTRGAFSARYWWDSLQNDWMRRNGRLADGVLRLVLRPGPWFYPLFGPALLTAAGIAMAVTAHLAARARSTQVWMWIASLSLIPLVCWVIPGTTGDVILWTAAAVNYVLPLALLVGSIGLFLLLLDGRNIRWPLVAAGAVMVALTDLLQETTSWSMMLVAVAVLALRRGRLTARLWLLTATALVTFVVHLTAPGLWARSDLIVDSGHHGFLETALRGVAASGAQLVSRTQIIWLALAAMVAVQGLRSSRPTRERVPLVAAAGATGLLVITNTWYSHRVPISADSDPSLTAVLLAAAPLMLAFLCVGVAFLVTHRSQGPAPLLLWVGLVGSCVLTFASGSTGPRVHFIPTTLLLLILVVLVAPAVGRLAPAQSVALAILLTTVPGALWFDEARLAAAANQRFVSSQIVAPLEAAARGEATSVTIPRSLPRPAFAYRAAFLLDRYETPLRIYYDIPDDIPIQNP